MIGENYLVGIELTEILSKCYQIVIKVLSNCNDRMKKVSLSGPLRNESGSDATYRRNRKW